MGDYNQSDSLLHFDLSVKRVAAKLESHSTSYDIIHPSKHVWSSEWEDIFEAVHTFWNIRMKSKVPVNFYNLTMIA